MSVCVNIHMGVWSSPDVECRKQRRTDWPRKIELNQRVIESLHLTGPFDLF